MTGIGAVTPLGNDVRATWENLVAGKSGIRTIQSFDTTDLPTKFGGEVRELNIHEYIPPKQARRMDRYIHYGLIAAIQTVQDSKLSFNDLELRKRTGIITGVGLGGLPEVEKNHTALIKESPRRVNPFFIPSIINNMVSGYISMHFSLHGPNLSISTACAAGAHAIGEAYRMLQTGVVDVMIAGGAEGVVSRFGFASFNAMRALSTRNDAPEKASRPFDAERDGFVMSDGAGLLVLEEYDHALARGAHIYSELVGFGMSSDASHITQPSSEGEWTSFCMDQALKDAGVSPSEIGYINAHGTSTPLGDIAETNAIKRTFGKSAYDINISSTKSMTGHLLGASGGIEAIFSTLALYQGVIPPTINLDNPDSACDLNYTPNQAVKRQINYEMSNSFGFGGTNASLVFKRYEGA